MRRLYAAVHYSSFPFLIVHITNGTNHELARPIRAAQRLWRNRRLGSYRDPTGDRHRDAAPGSLYFTAEDGVILNGKIVGTGTTAIIFSAMDADPKEEWMAESTRWPRPDGTQCAMRAATCLPASQRQPAATSTYLAEHGGHSSTRCSITESQPVKTLIGDIGGIDAGKTLAGKTFAGGKRNILVDACAASEQRLHR